jgi:uncharacterized protein (TIGR03000 family)
MSRQRLAILALGALLTAGSSAARAAEGGHGGGAGHVAVAAGHAGFGPRSGWYGGYGPRYRGYYGYPGWYGVGLGFGLGYGVGYGYPYVPYGYPIYVDPICGLPPNAGPQAGPAVAQAAVPVPPSGSAGPAAPVRLTETDVLLHVHVPPDASVRINGEKTTQNGPHREFISSGLSPGHTYTFDVRAQWTGPNGEAVDFDRRISVQGGERRTIDFLMPLSPRTDVLPTVRAGR